MKHDDTTRLRHMIEAAETARQFIDRRQRSDLDNDVMLRFALVRAVEIIGEAASKVSDEARSAAPSVPWIAIAGMRNRLIHAYFDVDLDILWKTVTDEIPDLITLLSPLLPTD